MSSSEEAAVTSSESTESPVAPQKAQRSASTELPGAKRDSTPATNRSGGKKQKKPLVSTQFEDVRKKLHPNLPLPHKVTRGLHELTMNTPSPGPKYLPNDSFAKRVAPAVSIASHSDRFGSKMELNRFIHQESPGPVYYVENKWRTKPVSFGKGDRFRTFNDTHPSPGPADYSPDATKSSRYTSVRSIGLGKTDRPMNAVTPDQLENEQNEKRRERHRIDHTPQKKKKKKGTRIIGGPLRPGAPSTFGTAHSSICQPSLGPGPAAYQPASTSSQTPGREKPLSAIKGATLRTSGRDIPLAGPVDDIGPGHFSPNYDSIHAKAPSALCYLTGA